MTLFYLILLRLLPSFLVSTLALYPHLLITLPAQPLELTEQDQTLRLKSLSTLANLGCCPEVLCDPQTHCCPQCCGQGLPTCRKQVPGWVPSGSEAL